MSCRNECDIKLQRKQKDLENAKKYVDLFPCNECAKIIIQSGIKHIIYLSDKYANSENNIASRRLFDECGVKYEKNKIRRKQRNNNRFRSIKIF